jgi:hypothetical protein
VERLTFLRLAGISSAAAFVGGKYLGEPAAAWAMNPRFDTTLRITSAGTVIATGPTNFAPDEARARIWAAVVQASRVQTGMTGWVRADSGSWSQVLTGQALKRGAADAYGVAYVQDHDGSYEWYPWGLAVTLHA